MGVCKWPPKRMKELFVICLMVPAMSGVVEAVTYRINVAETVEDNKERIQKGAANEHGLGRRQKLETQMQPTIKCTSLCSGGIRQAFSSRIFASIEMTRCLPAGFSPRASRSPVAILAFFAATTGWIWYEQQATNVGYGRCPHAAEDS